jgi:uncharacterized protein (TIGR00725 family)
MKSLRKMRIGIIGSATRELDPHTLESSKKLGKILGKIKAEVITGTAVGAPHEVLLESKKYGSKTVGFSPDVNTEYHEQRHDNAPLSDFDKVIFIKGITKRSLRLVNYCDALVVLGGRMGTLSEYTIAFEENKPIAVLVSSKGISQHLKKITELCDKHRKEPIFFYSTIERLVEELILYLKKDNQWKELAEDYKDLYSITDEILGYKKVFELVKIKIKDKIVLDYGCGSGKFSRRLEELNPTKILAIDPSKEAIKLAKKYSSKKIEYKILKDKNLEFIKNNSLDYVFINLVLCCIKGIEEIKNVFSNIYSKLKKKGKLVILDPHPDSPGYTYLSWKRERPTKLISGIPLKVKISNLKTPFYDYWRSKQDYLSSLREVGFVIDNIQEPIIENNKSKKWKDETKQSPLMIIEAKK